MVCVCVLCIPAFYALYLRVVCLYVRACLRTYARACVRAEFPYVRMYASTPEQDEGILADRPNDATSYRRTARLRGIVHRAERPRATSRGNK